MAAKSHLGRAVNAARAALIAAGVLAPPACMTLFAQQDVPAVLTQPTEQARAELLRAVSEALYGAPVTIAADALTRESVLTIERSAPRSVENRGATGRVVDAVPEQFRLVSNGSQCVLVHQADGKRTQLKAARCAAKAVAQ